MPVVEPTVIAPRHAFPSRLAAGVGGYTVAERATWRAEDTECDDWH